MTTADYALLVSLLSLFVSLGGLGWSVWSKWIYPKAQVRMHMAVMSAFGDGEISAPFIAIYATNYGPSETTLKTLVCRGRAPGWWRKRGAARWNWSFLRSHSIPDQPIHGEIFGGMPRKLPVGEEFATFLAFKHEHLRDENVLDVGIVDVFDRRHWVPRDKVAAVIAQIRKDWPKVATKPDKRQSITAKH